MPQSFLRYSFLILIFCISAFAGYSNQSVSPSDEGSRLDFLIERATKLLPVATNHDTVVFMLNEADQLAKATKNQHDFNNILILRGLNEYFFGNYEQAIDYYYTALDLSEKSNDSLLIAKVNHTLGMIYDEMEDYNEAISYFNKSLQISTMKKDSDLMTKTYQNISISYQNKKDLTKALEFNDKANQLAKLRRDTTRIIDALNNFGTINYDQKKFDESLVCYQKALDLYLKIKDMPGVAMAYNNIALVYLDKKEYKQSLEFFMKSLHLATKLKMTDFIGDIYGNLTSYYEEQKDYKNAYLCNTKYNSIYDSLSGEKKNKMIRQIQAKYQLNKNARELEELKQNNQTQLRAINLAKSIQIYLFSITFLVIVFMVATFYLLVKEKKLARALKLKTAELKDLNVSKDKFFSIIAHDLTSPFNVLVGFTGMLKTDLDLFSKEELQRILSDLNQASENGFNLLQDLMVWSQTQTDRIQINKSNFSLIDVYNDVRSLVDLNLISKEQQLSADIACELTVFADRTMVSTVLRNLIFNSVKFSPKGSLIQVKSKVVGEFAHIQVVDHGIGIAPKVIDSLFVVGKNKTGFGTEGERGTGLGLAICHEFVEKNGGEIWVESKVGHGSVFSFSIPLNDTNRPA